jgi:SNF family Na+-dependent transporter
MPQKGILTILRTLILADASLCSAKSQLETLVEILEGNFHSKRYTLIFVISIDIYVYNLWICHFIIKKHCHCYSCWLLWTLLLVKEILITLHIKLYSEFIINNYSPKAKWLPVNIHRDEVEVNIHRYDWAWGE